LKVLNFRARQRRYGIGVPLQAAWTQPRFDRAPAFLKAFLERVPEGSALPHRGGAPEARAGERARRAEATSRAAGQRRPVDYKPSGPVGLSNAETTCLALLALNIAEHDPRASSRPKPVGR